MINSNIIYRYNEYYLTIPLILYIILVKLNIKLFLFVGVCC